MAFVRFADSRNSVDPEDCLLAIPVFASQDSFFSQKVNGVTESMYHIIKLSFILFLLAMVIGCGKPKISGKVVFSDDKAPLTQGTVFFHQGNEASRGEIQSDGTYMIGSKSTDDGLPRGTYKIAIKNTQTNVAKPGQLPIFENLIDRKYENHETSGLTLEVKSTQKYDIEVDRYKKK